MTRILLNVAIPGEPCAQKRHRWARGRIFDPSFDDKKDFLWQLKAACPSLKPDLQARIGVRLKVWTSSWKIDADNFLKFYMDALSPWKSKEKRKKAQIAIQTAQAFAIWGNDNQVDDVQVTVHRGGIEPRIEILVYEIQSDKV